MTRASRSLALSFLTALTACDASTTGDGGPVDAGSTADAGSAPDMDSGSTPDLDGGSGPDGSTPTPDAGATTIAFTLPDTSIEYARGTVRLQLVTTGPDPGRVELWKNGALLVVLPLPYTYDWLADGDPEGKHVFEARALLGGAVVASAERRFTIDRTGPTLTDARPGAGVSARLADGIEIELSEPLDPTTVTTTSVAVRVGAADITAERTLSPDGATIRVVPSGVTLPADITVVVSVAVTDRAGNALTSPVTHTVGYPAWADLFPPGTLSEMRYINEIAVSGSDVYVLHTDGWFANPIVSRWDGVSLTELPALPGTPTGVPRLAVTTAGGLVIAWPAGTPPDIHVADFVGGAWVERLALAGVDSTPFFFDFELGPSDEPYVARKVGTATIQVMRLSGTTWSAVGSDINPSITTTLYGFSFALDDARPVFGIDDGRRCLLIADGETNVAINSVGIECRRVEVVDMPGPGVNAMLSVIRQTGSFTYVSETYRYVGPIWSRLAGSTSGQIQVIAETPTGWIAATLTRVESSDGEAWPLDSDQPWDIDMFLGAPIIASYHQLHVPNGPPLTP